MSVELGPGLVKSIFDGIQRPLDIIFKNEGSFISRGVEANSLDRNKKWNFSPFMKEGEEVRAGDRLGSVQETSIVTHYIMVPFGIEGIIENISSGSFTVEDTIATIKDKNGTIQS